MDDLNIKWRDYLYKIYKYGHEHTKDDSPIREYLGYNVFVKPPISTDFTPNNKQTFLYFLDQGFINIEGYPYKTESLTSYVKAWDDEEMINCDNFVYTYPERVFNYPENQFNIIRDRLLNNIGSNRGVAVLYNPTIDYDREDIPCLNWLQATVRNNKLRLHCMFRSNDIYGAWPSNMLLLSYLGYKLSEELENVSFLGIDYHCSSAHYYKTDEEAVKKIIGV